MVLLLWRSRGSPRRCNADVDPAIVSSPEARLGELVDVLEVCEAGDGEAVVEDAMRGQRRSLHREEVERSRASPVRLVLGEAEPIDPDEEAASKAALQPREGHAPRWDRRLEASTRPFVWHTWRIHLACMAPVHAGAEALHPPVWRAEGVDRMPPAGIVDAFPCTHGIEATVAVHAPGTSARSAGPTVTGGRGCRLLLRAHSTAAEPTALSAAHFTGWYSRPGRGPRASLPPTRRLKPSSVAFTRQWDTRAGHPSRPTAGQRDAREQLPLSAWMQSGTVIASMYPIGRSAAGTFLHSRWLKRPSSATARRAETRAVPHKN
eukprot:6175577-Pleurochrysis_carterae.AAC.3